MTSTDFILQNHFYLVFVFNNRFPGVRGEGILISLGFIEFLKEAYKEDIVNLPVFREF